TCLGRASGPRSRGHRLARAPGGPSLGRASPPAPPRAPPRRPLAPPPPRAPPPPSHVGPSPGPPKSASRPALRYDARPMLDRIREMPGGIRLFLVYAFLILAGIGTILRYVVDLAISTPVSFEGLVVMILLAYTIFTTTLVLQRKQAARGLALGLASLTIPLVPFLALSRLIVEAVFVATFGLLLFRGLLRPEVR